MLKRTAKMAGFMSLEQILRLIIATPVGIYAANSVAASEYGSYTAMTAILGFLLVAGALGTDAAVMARMARYPENANKIATNAFILCGIGGILSFLFAVGMTFWYPVAQANSLLFIIVASMSLIFPFAVNWLYLRSKSEGLLPFLSNVIGMICGNAVILVASIYHYGTFWFGIGILTESVMATITMLSFSVIRKELGIFMSHFDWPTMKWLIKTSVPLSFQTLVSAANNRAGIIIAERIAGHATAGVIGAVDIVANLPVAWVNIINTAMLPFVASHVGKGKKNEMSYALMVGIGLVLSLLSIVMAYPIIKFFFAEQYHSGWSYVSVLGVSLFFLSMVRAVKTHLTANEAYSVTTTAMLIGFVVSVAISATFLKPFGPVALALGYCGANIAQLIYFYALPSSRTQMRTMLKSLYDAPALFIESWRHFKEDERK